MQRQQLNQYINIYLHRECRKTSLLIRCFIGTAENSLTGGVFIFLFMVTGREIIFICGAELANY